jgi:hypothetical protein
MKNTGRSSSTAAASSAPTSWHSLAATTTMFGMPRRSFSSDCECVGP